MADTKDNIININGTEYDTDSFNNEQKYVIAQIRDLQARFEVEKFKLDQTQVALQSFTSALIKSLEESEEEEVEAEKVASLEVFTHKKGRKHVRRSKDCWRCCRGWINSCSFSWVASSFSFYNYFDMVWN